MVESWLKNDEIPPRYPNCGSFLRLDVVWFGEMLPPQAITAAIEAAQQCDLFMSLGTSSLVQPAASLPVETLERAPLSLKLILTRPLCPYT